MTGGKEIVSQLLSPYFLYPPPIAPVFLAGFLAPRASWLLGGLIGVVQSIATLVIVVSSPALGSATTADSGVFLYSLVVSVGFGAFYAAAAAWYRRFLQEANPPRRAAATSSKSSSKPKSGRTSSSRSPSSPESDSPAAASPSEPGSVRNARPRRARDLPNGRRI